MSAEIIPFGNSAAVPPPRPRRRWVMRHGEKTSARFICDDELYEAEFCDGSLQRVVKVDYRVNVDGVQEIKRRGWNGTYHWHLSDLDPAVVKAAERARANGATVDDVPFREAALAQLRKRREKLARMIEKVEATIASMERSN